MKSLGCALSRMSSSGFRMPRGPRFSLISRVIGEAGTDSIYKGWILVDDLPGGPLTGRHLQPRVIGRYLTWLRRQLATGIGFRRAVVLERFLRVDCERDLVGGGVDRRDSQRARQIDTAARRFLAADIVLHHLMMRVRACLTHGCIGLERVDLLAVAHHLQLPVHDLLSCRLLGLSE